MTNLFHIAAIDIENIIPVIIVVGVIISKIVKGAAGAKKMITNQKTPANKREPAYNAAPSELKNFLATLAGVPQEAKETAAATPPAPPRQVAHHKYTTKQTAPKKIKRAPLQEVTVPTVPTSTPVAEKKKYHQHTKSSSFQWNTGSQKTSLVSPAEIANELISRRSLAKAILLKEILGPPIALREV
ncbi:MAG: hypothetical protein KAI74_04795 [Kiritimatiellae bacterium]|nr:hypothetical protein [Kiritimatiellia bacterium]